MLPQRPSPSSSALQRVLELPKGSHPPRLRVELFDGTVVEGDLIAVSPEHLSLLSSTDKLEYVPADQVRDLYLGERRSFRELLVLAGVACATTAILVAAAQVPYFREHIRSIAVPLCAFVIGGVLVARKQTFLGSWLTSWKALSPPP